ALAVKMPLLEEVQWPLFCSAGRTTPIKWTADNVLHVPKYVYDKIPHLKDVLEGNAPRLLAY
ncbi:hypothetical protein FRC12_019581, partial [Ceratobasidium sp. 428]